MSFDSDDDYPHYAPLDDETYPEVTDPEILADATYLGISNYDLVRLVDRRGIFGARDYLADQRFEREAKEQKQRKFERVQADYLALHPNRTNYQWLRISSYDSTGDETPTVFVLPPTGPTKTGINIVTWLNIPNLLRTAALLSNAGFVITDESGDLQTPDHVNISHRGILVAAYDNVSKEYLDQLFQRYETIREFVVNAIPTFRIQRKLTQVRNRNWNRVVETDFEIITNDASLKLNQSEYGSLQKFFGHDEFSYLFYGTYHVSDFKSIESTPMTPNTQLITLGLQIEISFGASYDWKLASELINFFQQILQHVLTEGTDFKLLAYDATPALDRSVGIDSTRLRGACKLIETRFQTKLGDGLIPTQFQTEFSLLSLQIFQAVLYLDVPRLDQLIQIELIEELYELYAYFQCTMLPFGRYLNGYLGTHLLELEFDQVEPLLMCLLDYGYAPEVEVTMVGQLQALLKLWRGTNNAGGHKLTDTEMKSINFKLDWPLHDVI